MTMYCVELKNELNNLVTVSVDDLTPNDLLLEGAIYHCTKYDCDCELLFAKEVAEDDYISYEDEDGNWRWPTVDERIAELDQWFDDQREFGRINFDDLCEEYQEQYKHLAMLRDSLFRIEIVRRNGTCEGVSLESETYDDILSASRQYLENSDVRFVNVYRYNLDNTSWVLFDQWM